MKCECGKELSPHSLKCESCGRAWRLDANVIGLRNPELSMERWQEELKNRPKPSPIVKFGVFLLFVAIIAGLIDLAIRFSLFFYLHYGYLTYALIILTCLVSLWGIRNTRIIGRLKFQSSLVYEQGQYYRMITTGLVHADGAHLFFNMISLLSIGVGTEYDFNRVFGLNGPGLFVALYLLALIAADPPKLIHRRHDRFGSSVGASGAVVGLLSALVIIDPSVMIWGAIPGRYFLIGFVVVSYYLAKKGTSRIDHMAHIYGAIFGFIFIAVVGKYYGINFLASL